MPHGHRQSRQSPENTERPACIAARTAGSSLSSASVVATATRCRHSPSAAEATCQAAANCRPGFPCSPLMTAFSHPAPALASTRVAFLLFCAKRRWYTPRFTLHAPRAGGSHVAASSPLLAAIGRGPEPLQRPSWWDVEQLTLLPITSAPAGAGRPRSHLVSPAVVVLSGRLAAVASPEETPARHRGSAVLALTGTVSRRPGRGPAVRR